MTGQGALKHKAMKDVYAPSAGEPKEFFSEEITLKPNLVGSVDQVESGMENTSGEGKHLTLSRKTRVRPRGASRAPGLTHCG